MSKAERSTNTQSFIRRSVAEFLYQLGVQQIPGSLYSNDPFCVMAAFKRWQARYKRYKLQIPPQMRNRIILHYGLFKITWDWMIMGLVLYTAVEVPLVSAFILTQVDKNNKLKRPDVKGHTFERIKELYPSAYPPLITDICVDVIFMIDILLNFRSTYVEEGEVLITNPYKIAFHYLKSYFVIDLVAAVPWELIINSDDEGNTTLFSLLKTARLLRLFRAARKLDRNYEYMTSLLFLMLMFFMLVAHWMACAWYAIGFSEVDQMTSWLYKLADESGTPFNFTADPMLGPPLSARYLTSLYYVMTLCTTVGFGNVSANTNAERIFTICGMVLGAVMYAGIFGNVTAIIHGQYSSNFRYRKESMAVNEFIHFFKVKNPLARRLREYSRHTWSQTKGTDMNKVLKRFPEGLQYEIYLHMHLTVLSDSFLFLEAESSCLRSISMRMRRNHHLPGHYILYEGDEVDTLHLIKKGKIEILVGGVPKGKLIEGDAFGISLRQVDSRVKSAIGLRASACVDCHVIKITELNDALEPYPSVRQRLLELMDAAGKGPREEKVPNNGDISHLIEEEKNTRRRVDSDARHFVSQTYRLRPIFGCKKGSDVGYDENEHEENPLSPDPQAEPKMDNVITSHVPEFVNITDLSVLRPVMMKTDQDDEESERRSNSNRELKGYEHVESDDPVLSEPSCTDCEGDAHTLGHGTVEKVRQMCKDIKRLESKVDTLLNILAKQGSINSMNDNSPSNLSLATSTTV